MKKYKIFITGIAGFIGSHLAESFISNKLESEFEIVGIDNFNNYYDPEQKRRNAKILEAKGVRVYDGDLCDISTKNLSELIKDSSFIYHLAAQPGISQSVTLEKYTQNNIYATENLIKACLTTGYKNLKLFANISTSSVYGHNAICDENTAPKPVSFYGITKWAAEQLVLFRHRQDNFPACSFRLFSVYGPRERPDKLFPKLINNTLQDLPVPIFEGSEEHRRSFTFVKDIAKGLILAVKDPEKCIGEIFNLGNPHKISTGESIKIVEKILQKEIKIDRKPKRLGDQLETQANINKIHSVLGFYPETSFEQGIRETIQEIIR